MFVNAIVTSVVERVVIDTTLRIAKYELKDKSGVVKYTGEIGVPEHLNDKQQFTNYIQTVLGGERDPSFVGEELAADRELNISVPITSAIENIFVH